MGNKQQGSGDGGCAGMIFVALVLVVLTAIAFGFGYLTGPLF